MNSTEIFYTIGTYSSDDQETNTEYNPPYKLQVGVDCEGSLVFRIIDKDQKLQSSERISCIDHSTLLKAFTYLCSQEAEAEVTLETYDHFGYILSKGVEDKTPDKKNYFPMSSNEEGFWFSVKYLEDRYFLANMEEFISDSCDYKQEIVSDSRFYTSKKDLMSALTFLLSTPQNQSGRRYRRS